MSKNAKDGVPRLSGDLMDLLFKLLLLPLAHWLILWYRERFRRNVKVGDVVGVRFSEDVVLNRTVVHKLKDEIIVKTLSGHYLISVKLDKVYLPEHKEGVDQAFSGQYYG